MLLDFPATRIEDFQQKELQRWWKLQNLLCSWKDSCIPSHAAICSGLGIEPEPPCDLSLLNRSIKQHTLLQLRLLPNFIDVVLLINFVPPLTGMWDENLRKKSKRKIILDTYSAQRYWNILGNVVLKSILIS